MLSIFTPTHRPDHLMAAWNSFRHDSNVEFEWIVVPNGGAKIPDEIVRDRRVRVVPAPDDMRGVGALKRFACEQSRGDQFVELDHDDEFAIGALPKMEVAFAAGADFVYSDFASVRDDGSCEVYNPTFGWESYGATIRNSPVSVMSSFEPSAAALHQIYYAPNHVRAWTRDAYARAGGHDASIPVTDDHDLLCRTYLSGAKFTHIPQCLYVYHLHGSNTYIERNAEIQQRQQQVGNRYVYRLIAEECRRRSLPMLDLGGGHNCPQGYTPIDLSLGHEVFGELRAMDESSIGAIRAHDFLEHIPHCRDSKCTHQECVVALMNEIYRVLVPGGWLLSATPSTDGRGAFQDPTHCSFWNRNSFFYWTRAEQQKYVPGIKAKFQATRVWDAFPNDWCKLHNIPYIYADLVALKGQRQCGLSEF